MCTIHSPVSIKFLFMISELKKHENRIFTLCAGCDSLLQSCPAAQLLLQSPSVACQWWYA